MKPCDQLPRRWDARGEWSHRWHALFCAECRQARSVDRKLAEGIRALRQAPAPSAVERHVLQRLGLPLTAQPAAGECRRRVTALPIRWEAAAVAAALLAAAGIAFIAWPSGRGSGERGISFAGQPYPLRIVQQRGSEPSPAVQQPDHAPAPIRAGTTPVRWPQRLITPAATVVAQHSAAGKNATPVPAAGDLGYLNGEPAHENHRWAPSAADGWEQLAARVCGQVQIRDDFVTIPFPRLAAASDRQVAAAAESYKREAAIVDARLAREVTVAAKAMALADLCERLRSDTGIQLVAGRSVADEKVTVMCEKQPLREIMRQLSRPFGYTWLRSGKAGEYRYELVQDLKSQLMEEELRNRDRNQALVALDREMSQFHPYLGLTPDQARARARNAPPGEKELLEKLAGPGWAAIQMYSRLSPRELAALRAGETLKFSSQPKAGEQSLPAEVASGIPQEPPMRPHAVTPESEPAVPNVPAGGGIGLGGEFVVKRNMKSLPEASAAPHTEAHLSIEQSELGQFTLTGAAGRMAETDRGEMQMWINMDSLAVGQSPAIMKPQNGATNAALKSDPALRKRVALAPTAGEGERPAASAGGRESGTVRTAPHAAPRVTIADVLEKLHRATGMPIVADFYTRLYRPEAVTVKDMPLFEALNQLCDTMRMRWNKEAGGGGAAPRGEASTWLQFRSASFFHDRLKEVPNRLLAHWAASRKEHGTLTLDDLIEIAQLSDAQLNAAEMVEGAREIWGLTEWDLARGHSARPHLRFMASFNPAQRQAAAGGEGLAFTKMSLAQQQQFITLIAGREGEPSQSIEELAEAALRVDYAPEGSFEWRRPQGDRFSISVPSPGLIIEPPAVRERTREAALAAARRIDPAATEAQIAPTQAALMILYTTPSPQGRAPLLALRVGGGGANVTANRIRLRGSDGENPPAP